MKLHRDLDVRPVITAALLSLAIAFVASCGGSDDGESATWLPRYSGDLNTDETGFEGTIVQDGRCLYVGDYLPIFPKNSSFHEESGVLKVLGKKFKVGETFHAGGSEGGVNVLKEPSVITQPDASCNVSKTWVVGELN